MVSLLLQVAIYGTMIALLGLFLESNALTLLGVLVVLSPIAYIILQIIWTVVESIFRAV